jgi:geranylgeranyl diphosphate synthase, type II
LARPAETTIDIKQYMAASRKRVDGALERLLPPDDSLTLHRAMRYSVFAGGKRIRPILAMAACEAAGGRDEDALAIACALEMIHTYSLVHDDLPCMDNDELRRGAPTTWVKFGDGVAVLTGDALLTLAFEVLSQARPRGGDAAWLVREIAEAAGMRGMIGGQVRDLEGEGAPPDIERVRQIHKEKTAALIRASITAGAFCGGARGKMLENLGAFGETIGLAFQAQDDILDVTETSAQLGKTAGKDANRRKQTYPAAVGIDAAREELARLSAKAREALDRSGADGARLMALADFVITRRQ